MIGDKEVTTEFSDGFESDTAGLPPTNWTVVTTNGWTVLVTNADFYEGTKCVRINFTTGTGDHAVMMKPLTYTQTVKRYKFAIKFDTVTTAERIFSVVRNGIVKAKLRMVHQSDGKLMIEITGTGKTIIKDSAVIWHVIELAINLSSNQMSIMVDNVWEYKGLGTISGTKEYVDITITDGVYFLGLVTGSSSIDSFSADNYLTRWISKENITKYIKDVITTNWETAVTMPSKIEQWIDYKEKDVGHIGEYILISQIGEIVSGTAIGGKTYWRDYTIKIDVITDISIDRVEELKACVIQAIRKELVNNREIILYELSDRPDDELRKLWGYIITIRLKKFETIIW